MRRRVFLGLAAAAAAQPIARASESTANQKPQSGPNRPGEVVSVKVSSEERALAVPLDAALGRLTGQSGKAAWEQRFRPEDRVAIKLNCLAPQLSPDRRIVAAIVSRLEEVGIPPGNIIVFERTSRELERSGYPIQKGTTEPRCFGTDALQGGGYGHRIEEHRSIASIFTQILTDHSTVLINVGVCKDHDLSGVSAGCKNLYGLIHNPNRYHANRCDPFLADLLDHPAVRPKLKLTIIDALRAQCHGGPAFSSDYIFHPGKLFVSLDPVAVDRIAWEVIETERAHRGLPPLADEKREPSWISSAGSMGLGEADLKRIAVHEVEA